MKENYPIYEQWYKTLIWILDRVEKFPKNARFSIASRLADEALNLMEYIIESIYTKNRVPILDKINLCLEKQRVFFRISFDKRFISAKQYEFISREINLTGQMVGGWRKQSL
jgi:hypothetical protein